MSFAIFYERRQTPCTKTNPDPFSFPDVCTLRQRPAVKAGCAGHKGTLPVLFLL